MAEYDCFNLNDLNNSLFAASTVQKLNKEENRSAEIKLISQQNDEYGFDEEFNSSFDIFLEKFKDEVISMKLQQKNSDRVFSLCVELISEYSSFLSKVIQNSTIYDPALNEILSKESKTICEKFSKMNAAYKRNKDFEQNPFYVRPTERNIGISWRTKVDVTKSIPNYILKSNTYHYVSLIEKLNSLFSRIAFSEMFLNFNKDKIHICEKGVYIDYCCGQNASQCDLFNERNGPIIMIDIGADAFEICSPLKTKANTHKLMAVYFRIRNLPPEYRSRLHNYHLIALCNTEHFKQNDHSFHDIIGPLVNEIKYLESIGIIIGNKTIKGTMINFCGDNLGSNEAYGFIKCFSTDYFCRMCICTKRESETQTSQEPNIMRNEISYRDLVTEAITGDYKSSKGVVGYCIFNDLKYFHIFKNYTVDLMHDFNEGILHTFFKIIFEFTLQNHILKSYELVSKVRDFNYGYLFSKKKPSPLNLKKHNFNQNATQTYTLMIHLPFIFHKWKVELSDIWCLMELLLQIMQIVFSSKIEDKDLERLSDLSKRYLSALVNRNIKLTPKHHFLVHYPTVIRNMGPVVHMWTMRMESKHKEFTSHARTLNCFKNVSLSLATRHEQLASLETYEYKNEIEKSYHKTALKNCSNFVLYNTSKILEKIPQVEQARVLKHLKINSYEYRQGLMLIRKNFALEVEDIVDDGQFWLICSRYEMVSFDRSLNSIVIEKIDPDLIALNILQEDDKETYQKYCLNGQIFIIADTLNIFNCFDN